MCRLYRRHAVLHIEGWIHEIYVFLIQLFPKQLYSFTKSLEVDNLPFPQEFDYIVHIRVVAEAQDVVIGHSGFLLWHAQSFATK